ncbi:PepSY-associated TM helix domain-containing protein [Azospirillum halopraeferens]|uniref:PepSY-associated TM helix domain-containing protein n=1 Tax=Azospirillum halopraeferens TaxID=34010 RepID=UPI00040D2486|nr:PepSY-associated TM helix domain-containing protein [Azospirillum halopraeferens]
MDRYEAPPAARAHHTAASRSQRTWYRVLQQFHLWCGIILCVPLVVLGITGSILVFEHELEDLFTGGPARPATAAGAAQPLSALVAAVEAGAPDGFAVSLLQLPAEPGDPVTARLAQGGRPGPGGRTALVDPVTLDVAWSDPAPGLMRRIFLLHANLLVPDRSGREAVGWLGVAMLGLGLSGLVLWWPRPGRVAAAFTVARGARGVRLHREVHGAVGIWSLVVFIVVTFSGVYLAFPQTVGAVFPGRDLRAAAAAVRVEPLPGAQRLTPEAATAIATASVPDGTVQSVGLPARPDQPYRIGIALPGHEHGAPLVSVFVDPWRGRAVEVLDPRTYSVGETIAAWQRPLHAGQGLGWVWKILVFLSGALPPLFAVTGVAMWLLKRRARRATAAQRARARTGTPRPAGGPGAA